MYHAQYLKVRQYLRSGDALHSTEGRRTSVRQSLLAPARCTLGR